MTRINYLYQIQINDDSEVKNFTKIMDIVKYLNDVYNMPLFSRDILHGWFRDKHKRKNIILQNIKLIDRIQQPNKLAPRKEKVKL